MFKEAKSKNTHIIVERIVEDIDDIVKKVRFDRGPPLAIGDAVALFLLVEEGSRPATQRFSGVAARNGNLRQHRLGRMVASGFFSAAAL